MTTLSQPPLSTEEKGEKIQRTIPAKIIWDIQALGIIGPGEALVFRNIDGRIWASIQTSPPYIGCVDLS